MRVKACQMRGRSAISSRENEKTAIRGFAANEARVVHAMALDADIARAIRSRTLDENMQIIEQHS